MKALIVRTSVGIGDTVRVNRVGIVVLRRILGSADASEGGNAKGKDGTHVDGDDVVVIVLR